MFRGAMVAIVTPFKDDRVDEARLRELIEFQLENGTQGIIPCGTTGESATLSMDEHERVVDIAIEQVNKRVPVIAGSGSNNTAEAIRLTRHAKQAGADGALMISPYYNKPTQEGLYRHFAKVASEVDIPIIVYNIQGRTAVNIETPTMERLSKIDNIVGVKEASGSIKQIAEVVAACGEDFAVISGEDYITYPLLCVGGCGVISVVSNVAPKDMADMCTLHFEGRQEEARRMFHKLLPLCNAMFFETNPVPAKTALAMMGKIDDPAVRLPLAPMLEANKERLRAALQAYGLV
jgi:4-hydroxy-tetrahydrodipicolinate synthase